ncbi:MAG: ribonuclease Z [Gemmatimonadetes bacterium]|jgi:ribonuclease Z|nr:ribonuclease Z [Gemmatimonadota bacterium]
MIQITFLGTSAAVPTVDRNVAALMVQRAGESLLFDCGEGTQRQMMRYGTGFLVNEIFLTHYHTDHTLGIPGLLRGMSMQARTAPLRFYGPRGAERTIGQLVALGMDRTKFEVEITELKPGDVLSRGDYDLVVGEAAHRGECLAYALAEHERLGRFDPDLARSLGIPEGPLWGKLHRGEAVPDGTGRMVTSETLVGPSRRGRKVVYTGDTVPCESVRTLAQGADLLIHEATFGEDEKERALETRHSLAREAAMVARDAGVRQLYLTHISARYSREAPELAAQARAVFPDTTIARDGMIVEVGFGDDAKLSS